MPRPASLTSKSRGDQVTQLPQRSAGGGSLETRVGRQSTHGSVAGLAHHLGLHSLLLHLGCSQTSHSHRGGHRVLHDGWIVR